MAVGGRSSLRMSILNHVKVIFLTETKCKIRFIYEVFNCKGNIARIANAVQVTL